MPEKSQVFRSVFDLPVNETPSQITDKKSQADFAFDSLETRSSLSLALDAEILLTGTSSWDLAVRYQDFKNQIRDGGVLRQLREKAVEGILQKAHLISGSILHPQENRSGPWDDRTPEDLDVELDLDETLEQYPLEFLTDQAGTEHLWVSYRVPRSQPLVITVDTSLSMTGEKLAWTAVALAVVLLQFQKDPVGVLVFENEARSIQEPGEKAPLFEILGRFLDAPAQGYTHLEEGVRASLRMVGRVRSKANAKKPPATVLITDGKYTAGRDPAFLASRFPRLCVVKMGSESSGERLCREMAHKGRGPYWAVEKFEELPWALSRLVKDLLTRSSFAYD